MNTKPKSAAAMIAAALTAITLAAAPSPASAAPSCQEFGDDLLVEMDRPGQTVALRITAVDIFVSAGTAPGSPRLDCSATTIGVDRIIVRDETKRGSTHVVLEDGREFSDSQVVVETELGAGRDDSLRVEGDDEMDAFLVHGRSILAPGTIATTKGVDAVELIGDGGQDTLGAYSALLTNPEEAAGVAAKARISAIGGAGPDYLLGGARADRLAGGASRDTLVARDGNRDARINCGGGRDRFTSDRAADPKPKRCETRGLPSSATRVSAAKLGL